MKKSFLLFSCLSCIACSPFSPLAVATLVTQEAQYMSVSNSKADLKSLTFGDFEIARNRKELKQTGGNVKGLNNMLFYAKTSQPEYAYCIMHEPKNLNENHSEFTFKDTLIQKQRFVLAISKKAPDRDVAFIKKHLYPFRQVTESGFEN